MRIPSPQPAGTEKVAIRHRRTGRHAEVGSITVESYTAHMAAHDLAHLAQIARLLTPA
jgi:hypothetical protein